VHVGAHCITLCIRACCVCFHSEWKTPATGRQFQSSKRQSSSSLFDVSSLPWSQHKSMTPGLFGAGGDSAVSKSGNFLFY